jgi:hypothetical protein
MFTGDLLALKADWVLPRPNKFGIERDRLDDFDGCSEELLC